MFYVLVILVTQQQQKSKKQTPTKNNSKMEEPRAVVFSMINKENCFISTEDMSLEEHQTTLSEYDGDHPTKSPHIGTLVVGIYASPADQGSIVN
jgi:biopolymer transport protein ExbD